LLPIVILHVGSESAGVVVGELPHPMSETDAVSRSRQPTTLNVRRETAGRLFTGFSAKSQD